MKTKEEDWVKASFDVAQDYLNNDPKHIADGRQYKCFGLDVSNNRKVLYHLPTKTFIAVYKLPLKDIKEIVDRLLEIDINWTSSDLLYFQNLDREITSKINKIILGEVVIKLIIR